MLSRFNVEQGMQVQQVKMEFPSTSACTVQLQEHHVLIYGNFHMQLGHLPKAIPSLCSSKGIINVYEKRRREKKPPSN